ncbi:MAG: hypothetical protein LBL75_02775 [Rickettsiales bacterium]|jgi:hypothetical protein|nr:hypothetical protein [Rickettsiales bacterium]
MSQLVTDVTDILDNKQDKKAAESERKKILEQIKADEKTKTNLVKKALATQRAKFGAAGMSANGITEEAVLKRLREETEEPYAEKKKSNLAKLSATKTKKSNLLKSMLGRIGDLFVG